MGDYRGFHKWGTAIAECFIMENPIKMNELGVPLFLGNLHISHITIVVTTACHWFKVSLGVWPCMFCNGSESELLILIVVVGTHLWAQLNDEIFGGGDCSRAAHGHTYIYIYIYIYVYDII